MLKQSDVNKESTRDIEIIAKQTAIYFKAADVIGTF